MFASHNQSSISLLSVLSVIIIIIGASTNAATVPSTSISELQTVDSIKKNETSRVIVYGKTRDKVPGDLICECVPFYLCDSENVIVLPTSHHDHDQNQCQGEVEACCAIRNETSSSSTSPSPVTTVSSVDPDAAKIVTYGTTDDGAVDLQCQCTVFYLCDQQDWITLPTTNQDQCPDPNVCCRIQAESGGPVTEIDIWSSKDAGPKVIKYEVIDGDKRDELRCYCTIFYQCSEENVVELPKTGQNEDQCPESYVCCKGAILFLD